MYRDGPARCSASQAAQSLPGDGDGDGGPWLDDHAFLMAAGGGCGGCLRCRAATAATLVWILLQYIVIGYNRWTFVFLVEDGDRDLLCPLLLEEIMFIEKELLQH